VQAFDSAQSLSDDVEHAHHAKQRATLAGIRLA